MPVTNLTIAAFQAQAGKMLLAGSPGTITFPTPFQAPPVLMLTVETPAGGEPAMVSITSVDATHATFVTTAGGRLDKIHWIAATAT